MASSTRREMSKRQKDFIKKVGYDVGEWLMDWIEVPIYKPSLALPLGIVGPTGTGKNNLAYGILWGCAEQGDCVVIPADSGMEFRHFLLYTQFHEVVKLKLIIPTIFQGKFDFFMGRSNEQSDLITELAKYGAEVEYYDIYEQSVNDFIEPAQILVIMDACFNLESKTWFWQYNCKQFKLRKRYHYVQLTYCFTEASAYFPNTPFKEQYKPTYMHSKDFIEFRRFLMRGVYLYHHSSMFWYLLEKQFETVIKKGSGYDKRTPFDNKLGRGKAIHEYTVYSQGYEDIKLEIEGMFQEMEEIWKVIPNHEQDFDYKKWEKDEKNKFEEKDEMEMMIEYWVQSVQTNSTWSIDERLVDFFLAFPNSSVRSAVAISQKSREFVNKRKVEAKMLQLEEAKDENLMKT